MNALAAAIALLMATTLAAQGWSALPAEQAPAAAAQRTLAVAADTTYTIDGADVVRQRGTHRVVLARTGPGSEQAPAPTGLVPGAGGIVYAIAGDVLFCTHADVDTLDRVEFAADGPHGPIVGAVADRGDRLWIATASEVFAVHTGQWFHRRHGAADGLPPPPYTALTAADGALVLHTPSGPHGYRPDPAPPELAAADVAALGATTTARLTGRVAGAGSPHLRWRAVSHHRLHEVGADGTIELRRPGRHALLAYAVDRDLDLSPPVAVTVDLPFGGGWTALHTAAAAVLLGLAGAAWRFARARRGGRGTACACIDAALALVVVLQLGMAMTGVGRTYPFIGFTMYDEVWHTDDVLFTPSIVVGAADGSTRDHRGELGFATDGVWRHLASLLFADDAARQDFVTRLGADVARIELRIDRCRLTRHGPRPVAPWVLAVVPRGGPR